MDKNALIRICRALIVLSCCIFSFLASAQKSPSVLKKQLATTTADTARCLLYVELGESYRTINIDSALYFLTQAEQLSQRLNRPQQTAGIMYSIARLYKRDKLDETKALEWLKKCVTVAAKINDHNQLAEAYRTMAIIADHQNLPTEPLLEKAVFHAQKASHWFPLFAAYGVLADVLRKKQKWQEAEAAYLNALKVAEKQSPMYWLHECMNYCQFLEGRGRPEEARPYYRKALSVQKQITGDKIDTESSLQLARLELNLKDYPKAEAYSLKAFALEKAQASPDSERVNRIYELLAPVYAAQKKYQQAYETKEKHFDLQMAIRDRAHQHSSELEMTRLQAALDKEKKESEITLLAAKQKQQLFFLISALAGLVVLAAFLLILNRNRRRIERQKVELTTLNATKDKLFAILSHDLRSPVGNLENNVMLTNWGALDQAEFAESTQSLGQEIGQVRTMLDNVLHWSISQMGGMQPKPENVTVAPIVQAQVDLLSPLAKPKGIELINQLPADITVKADKNHLAIIFRNIIQNAVKFTDTGGKITLYSTEKEDFAIFTITDTGIGMSKERLTHLFQLDKSPSRPGTAFEQGTGLGLVLVKELVEANGGTIQVSSEVNKGTAFTLRFKRI